MNWEVEEGKRWRWIGSWRRGEGGGGLGGGGGEKVEEEVDWEKEEGRRWRKGRRIGRSRGEEEEAEIKRI